MRGIALLGSTGSIGESTLRVIERHPERFRVVALAARSSAESLARQAARHGPDLVVLTDGEAGEDEPSFLRRGNSAMLELCERPDVDVVVNAVVGAAGLEASICALSAGKRLALANKESLVAGGPLVLQAAERGGGELVPIDSEHSAILQCLEGHRASDVRRIVLTASGGPFRGWGRERLAKAQPEQALRHPTWEMGAKITIDSATLANKALEVIEAHFLYGIDYDAIDVVVHPQSIVHSFVEFEDGSVLAQLGFPTMELPILFALAYPERVADSELQTFDPVRSSPLTFEDFDRSAFRLFDVGIGAGKAGGGAPAIFNAANEVAVEGFLEKRIMFLEMSDVVEETLIRMGSPAVGDFADVLEVDREARAVASSLLRGATVFGASGPEEAVSK